MVGVWRDDSSTGAELEDGWMFPLADVSLNSEARFEFAAGSGEEKRERMERKEFTARRTVLEL